MHVLLVLHESYMTDAHQNVTAVTDVKDDITLTK